MEGDSFSSSLHLVSLKINNFSPTLTCHLPIFTYLATTCSISIIHNFLYTRPFANLQSNCFSSLLFLCILLYVNIQLSGHLQPALLFSLRLIYACWLFSPHFLERFLIQFFGEFSCYIAFPILSSLLSSSASCFQVLSQVVDVSLSWIPVVPPSFPLLL